MSNLEELIRKLIGITGIVMALIAAASPITNPLLIPGGSQVHTVRK